MATTNASFSPFPFDELLEWHAGNRRDHLPWRDFTGRKQCDLAYRTWVSEIFLQQTQAERVIPYYKQVIAAYPSVEKLATASYEEFFGLYQ
ncbi:MAG TPA: hypothetical protein PK765_03605 [bacterium]|nr:hypothetical protein [bacterium]